MVQIEGAYTCFRSQEFVPLYEKIGFSKEVSEKLVNSHWTMTNWKDGEKSWGFYFTCKEHPEFNYVDVAEEDVEKVVDNEFFGGKSTILFTAIENGFFTKVKTDSSEYTCNETYDDKGVTIVWECDGATYTDNWTRVSPWSGRYVTYETKNLEDFFQGYSPEAIESFKTYAASFKRVGDVFNVKETFDGSELVETNYKLDEETEAKVPSKEDVTVSETRTAVLSKKPGDVFLIKLTSKEGNVEEWTGTFSDDQLEWHAVDHATNKECWFKLKKVNDFTGTYKPVARSGFKEFAESQGIPQDVAEECKNYKDGGVTIVDLGDGLYQFTSKMAEGKELDVNIKDGQEFEADHPILKEKIKGVANIDENHLSFTLTTSKGTSTSKFTFKGNYLINVSSGANSDVKFLSICEKV